MREAREVGVVGVAMKVGVNLSGNLSGPGTQWRRRYIDPMSIHQLGTCFLFLGRLLRYRSGVVTLGKCCRERERESE